MLNGTGEGVLVEEVAVFDPTTGFERDDISSEREYDSVSVRILFKGLSEPLTSPGWLSKSSLSLESIGRFRREKRETLGVGITRVQS